MPAIAAVTKDNAFYTALRTEIEKSTPTTPIDYSAARALGADNWIADALNFVPDSVKSIPAIGTAPGPNTGPQTLSIINVTDGAISQLEFSQALRLSEMTGLTAAQLAYLQILGSNPNGFNYSGRVATQLNAIFTATGAGSVQNQLSLKATRPGSRAEFLFGIGTNINTDDVTTARNLSGTGNW
jgi:hypothetical protein